MSLFSTLNRLKRIGLTGSLGLNFDQIIKNPKELLTENYDKWYDYLDENHENTYKNARELLRKKDRDDLENEFITQDDVDEEKKKPIIKRAKIASSTE